MARYLNSVKSFDIPTIGTLMSMPHAKMTSDPPIALNNPFENFTRDFVDNAQLNLNGCV